MYTSQQLTHYTFSDVATENRYVIALPSRLRGCDHGGVNPLKNNFLDFKRHNRIQEGLGSTKTIKQQRNWFFVAPQRAQRLREPLTPSSLLFCFSR